MWPLYPKAGEKITNYKIQKMKLSYQHNDLLKELQTGWVQFVQAIQDGNLNMISIESILAVSLLVVINLIILIGLIKMKLIGPILKFTIFVLVLGIFRLMIMAIKASSH